MSKIEIEVYKGQTIFYDEDSDKFVCDISVEDKSKSTKRQSLKDVRKEIEQFIKLNLEFKPFKVIRLGWGFSINTITSIRTDKKFVLSKPNSKNDDHISAKTITDIKEYAAYDQDVYEKYLALNSELKQFEEDIIAKQKALLATLKPVDLSKYEAYLSDEKQDTDND